MKIKSIDLFDYRGQTRTVELTDGLNAITGPNGSGKSSTVEAIIWVLSGDTLGGASPFDVLPIGGEYASATLNVLIKGDEHQITRRVEAETEDGRIVKTETSGTIDGIDHTAEKLNQEIKSLLGIGEFGFFGLNGIQLLMNPHYVIETASSAKWPEAREFLFGVIGGMSVGDGANTWDGLQADIKRNAKELKAVKADFKTMKEWKALQTRLKAVSPCWVDKYSTDDLKAVLDPLKLKLGALETEGERLSQTELTALQRAEDECLSQFGIGFSFVKTAMNGNQSPCLKPHLKDGKTANYGSRSEVVGGGVAIIKATRKRFNLPALPILIDEGGEITDETLRKWKYEGQIVLARAADTQFGVKGI